MEWLLPLGLGFALVMVPALVLLVRSARALSRARQTLAAAGIAIDESSDWGQAMRIGRRRGGWITAIVVGLIVIAYLVAILVTYAIEPDAAGWLAPPIGLVFLGPFLLALALLIPCWILGAMVAESHRLLTSPRWAEAAGAPVGAAVAQLRRVTWSQSGVTGIGVVAGVLSVIFGAGLIAALFVVATTAISCARDPKCI
ncbi:MAG TPA: hypothetical protein IAA98_12595 [Candidatus Avipropionibacterium avicola]|uniref:Uncharacterized protein n=1 Tax=Candidatus Avipropionibacterium avicola TaxID=2840701 RepID=A0A9D1GZI6_9ACTN|nr:hypothetical protein [Candidatus Avipropionibacterium avicola]